MVFFLLKASVGATSIEVISLGEEIASTLFSGEITKHAAARILSKYHEVKKQDFVIGNIVEQRGGATTSKLFKVYDTSNHPRYILKALKREKCPVDKAIAKMSKVQDELIAEISFLEQDDDHLDENLPTQFPKISFVKAIAIYKDKNNLEHCVEIIETAEGQSFAELLDNNAIDKESFCKSCHACGYALGLFHQASMQTPFNELSRINPTSWRSFAHRDFSLTNVFCSSENRITFIDNVTMARGFAMKDVKSFMFVLGESLDREDSTSSKRRAGMAAFTKGYIQSYPLQLHNQLRKQCDAFHQEVAVVVDKKKWTAKGNNVRDYLGLRNSP